MNKESTVITKLSEVCKTKCDSVYNILVIVKDSQHVSIGLTDTVLLTVADSSFDGFAVQFPDYGSEINNLINKGDVLFIKNLKVDAKKAIVGVIRSKSIIVRFLNPVQPYNQSWFKMVNEENLKEFFQWMHPSVKIGDENKWQILQMDCFKLDLEDAHRFFDIEDVIDDEESRSSDSSNEESLENQRQLLERAETSAELASSSVETIRKDYSQTKKRNKKITAGSSNASGIEEYLGSPDAVTVTKEGYRKVYCYKCPECSAYIRDKVARHLEKSHGYDKKDASLFQTRSRILFGWCQAKKHGTPLPLPCEECSEWHMRLDHHLANSKFHKEMSSFERKELLEAMRQKHWSKSSSVASSEAETVPDFTLRSANQLGQKLQQQRPQESSQPAADFVPVDAFRVDDTFMEANGLVAGDYLSIYYKDPLKLLDAFKADLMGSGTKKDVAGQHQNQVKLIWSTLSPDLEMYPKHPIANVHLLRHKYHIPSFKKMGTSDGVQAGSLRARYTSLSIFIQFLRRNQIYAGISRQGLHLLEDSLSDLIKTLNPHIKQRRVDVRAHKVTHLLQPSHFISYGQSSHIQNLIKSSKKQKLLCTKGFAVQFRDYLMTAFAIGNGLRASNLMNLTVKDIESAKDVEGYKGHKIVTNSNYKTSTIYGEKFIVIPDALMEHCRFYIEKLRPKLNLSSSGKLFLPNSESSILSATNVSSSLTASFQRSKVLTSFNHQRVSCTRIRCGIATYACNEGEMDVSFFARHFMKNREETTSIHYNLLSNRRHALNIAMHLYQKFSGHNDEMITVDDQDSLAKEIKEKTSRDPTTVINWLQKNSDADESEIIQFKNILETKNNESFYSKDKATPKKNDTATTSTTRTNDDTDKATPKKNDSATTSTTRTNDDTSISDGGKLLDQLCRTPQRKGRLFPKEAMLAIRRTCADFIFNGNILKENVMEATKNEPSLQHLNFVQLRAKISYLRLQVADQEGLIRKRGPPSKRKLQEESSEESVEEDTDNESEMSLEDESEENETGMSVEESDKEEETKTKDIAVAKSSLGTEDSEPKDKLKPSLVMEFVNQQFEKDAQRATRKRIRISQSQKALEFSRSQNDQNGFERLYIETIKGFGIFATSSFAKDDYLLTYTGEVIAGSEGGDRESFYKENGQGNFLFFCEIEVRGKRRSICVDATNSGGLCRYVNDSPANYGNCRMRKLMDTNSTPYLCLFATKDIMAGTELRYDYGDTDEGLWWRKEEKFIKPLNKEDLCDMIFQDNEDIIPPSPKKRTTRNTAKL